MRAGDILKSINSKPESEKPETLQHAMKAQGREVKVRLYSFLKPGAVWRQVSNAASRPIYIQDSAPFPFIWETKYDYWNRRCCSWLRHLGSFPDGIIKIFH